MKNLEKFLKQAEKIIVEHKAQYKGVYMMKGGVIGSIEHGISSGWNDIRDTAEAAASVVGNYLLPGSSLVTDQLVSQGAKKDLSSPLGLVAQFGSGLAGAGVGSATTGVPSASSVGAGWGNLASGLSNTASSAGDALGLTGDAAPWVDPDAAAAASGGTGTATATTAAPWVNPDVPVTPGTPPDIQSLNSISPGASAGASSPVADPNAITNALTTPTSAASADSAGLNPSNLTGNGVNIGSTALGSVDPSSISSLSSPAGALNLTNDAGAPIGSSLAGSVPAAAGGTGAAGGGSSLLKSVEGAAGPLISGAGLAMNLLKKPAVSGASAGEASTALSNTAAQEANQGTTLQNYITTGTLPAGAQAGIDQATNSAKAAVRSQYASMGMSGSSSEQQALAAIDANAQAQGEQEAQSLLDSGIQESQLSGQLYQNILNGALQQDQQLSSAIGNFTGSVAGTTKPNVSANV